MDPDFAPPKELDPRRIVQVGIGLAIFVAIAVGLAYVVPSAGPPGPADAPGAADSGADVAEPEKDKDGEEVEERVDVAAIERDLARFGITGIPRERLKHLDRLEGRPRARVVSLLPSDEGRLRAMLATTPPVARLAAERLAGVATPASVTLLADMVATADLDVEVRQALAETVGKLARPEDAARLLAYFNGPVDVERAGPLATAALEVAGARIVTIALDRTRDAAMRGAMLEALADEGGKYEALVPGVIPALGDPAPEVRKGAIAALANRPSSPQRGSYVAALMSVLEADADADVRREAAFALGTLGEKGAVATLKRALAKESNEDARDSIKEAIDALER